MRQKAADMYRDQEPGTGKMVQELCIGTTEWKHWPGAGVGYQKIKKK